MKVAVRVVAGFVALLVLLALAAAIYIYATALTPARPVGFQQTAATDPGHSGIPIAVWYPAKGKPGFALLGTRGMRVVVDGEVVGSNLPLIILSHGTGGSGGSHADTAIALAEQGFVVAALTHPGDNIGDDSQVGRPNWLADRSRHVSRSVDAMTQKWKDRSRVDPARIGMFGFSAGATTALISVGGKPDLSTIADHCSKYPEFVCKLTSSETDRNLSSPTWQADGRIKAAVIAAPGLGFTFEPNGLTDVRTPLQLWAGSADQTVPYGSNAGLISRLLPVKPEVHVVPRAVHYSFLMPCGLIGPPEICRDNQGFDRTSFHADFNRSIVAFFRDHLVGR